MRQAGDTNGPPPQGTGAFVAGHPGHELRVHYWLERTRPVVFVLTDGSGHGLAGRIGSTSRVLQAAGATPGSIYGRLADRDVYEALVRRDTSLWIAFAIELSDALLRERVAYLVADAAEGFNPTHDLCRYITDAAAARVTKLTGLVLPRYEFDLDAAADADADEAIAFRLALDQPALERKLSAGLGYPEMRDEVEQLLRRFGREAFAVEAFRPATSGQVRWTGERAAAYERYGRDRIARGFYQTLITYETHLAPVQDALAAVSEVTET